MPTNLSGPFDNFDLNASHVLPALIIKFNDAKEMNNAPVTLWGFGKSIHEFLFVDDIAVGIVFALENQLREYLYNVGMGEDLTIKELAEIIQQIIGHTVKLFGIL